METVIIYGTGPFAEQIKYKFEDEGVSVVAFVEGKKYKIKDTYLDLPVHELETLNEHFSKETCKIFVAIGYSKLNSLREEVCQEVILNGFTLFTFVSSKANISKNVTLGDNVLISEGVYIGPSTFIGNGVIILANVAVEHNVRIEDNVYLSNSLALGGNVVVEKNCFIGMNSTIRNGIIIRERNIIGAASNITKNTDPDSAYIGNPARKMNKKSSEVKI